MSFWICHKAYIHFICHSSTCLEWLYMDRVFTAKCYWVMYKVFDTVTKASTRPGNNDDWIQFAGAQTEPLINSHDRCRPLNYLWVSICQTTPLASSTASLWRVSLDARVFCRACVGRPCPPPPSWSYGRSTYSVCRHTGRSPSSPCSPPCDPDRTDGPGTSETSSYKQTHIQNKDTQARYRPHTNTHIRYKQTHIQYTERPTVHIQIDTHNTQFTYIHISDRSDLVKESPRVILWFTVRPRSLYGICYPRSVKRIKWC